MVHSYYIFQQTLYTIYRNPILMLMPLLGFMISVTTEAIFISGLYDNNNVDYFPFSNVLVTILFFVGFAITYIQLAITRRIILKKRFKDNTSVFRVEILILFIIYSIYALVLIQMGGYESDIRKRYVKESDRFSLYAVKLKNHSDMIAVAPDAVNIVLLSTIFSLIFHSWMVAAISRYKNMNIHVLYESLTDVIDIITKSKWHESQLKRIAFLFLFTLTISAAGFIFSNISVIPFVSTLGLYLFQFVISNVIIALYWPFFLVCLFFIMLPNYSLSQ